MIGSLAKRTMPIAIVPHYGQGDATKASRLLLADERVFEHGHATRAQTVIVVVTHAGPTDRLNDGSSAAEFGRSTWSRRTWPAAALRDLAVGLAGREDRASQ